MKASNHVILAPTVLAAAALALALPLGATAQQQPLTGRMIGGQEAPTTPAPVAPPALTPTAHTASPATPQLVPAPTAMQGDVPTAFYADDSVGAVTRQVLRMQVDGRHAGQRLPTLGPEASASYRRYLDSFNHPIPEFYETTIGKNDTNGG